MKLTRVGVDLAKQVFQVHGVDRAERPVWCQRLKRSSALAIWISAKRTLKLLCAGSVRLARGRLPRHRQADLAAECGEARIVLEAQD